MICLVEINGDVLARTLAGVGSGIISQQAVVVSIGSGSASSVSGTAPSVYAG